jgi:hypothetical protein
MPFSTAFFTTADGIAPQPGQAAIQFFDGHFGFVGYPMQTLTWSRLSAVSVKAVKDYFETWLAATGGAVTVPLFNEQNFAWEEIDAVMLEPKVESWVAGGDTAVNFHVTFTRIGRAQYYP